MPKRSLTCDAQTEQITEEPNTALMASPSSYPDRRTDTDCSGGHRPKQSSLNSPVTLAETN